MIAKRNTGFYPLQSTKWWLERKDGRSSCEMMRGPGGSLRPRGGRRRRRLGVLFGLDDGCNNLLDQLRLALPDLRTGGRRERFELRQSGGDFEASAHCLSRELRRPNSGTGFT